MSVKLLTEHHLGFLSLEGGCTGSSESTLVKIPHCWKSHVAAHLTLPWSVSALICFFLLSIFFLLSLWLFLPSVFLICFYFSLSIFLICLLFILLLLWSVLVLSSVTEISRKCSIQGTKIFQYCTRPAGRVINNFHSSCKHMYLPFKSLYNKEHKGATWLIKFLISLLIRGMFEMNC